MSVSPRHLRSVPNIGPVVEHATIEENQFLTVEVGLPDRLTYVRLRGDVDRASAVTLTATLDALIDFGPTALVIDLRSANFFGGAGVRAIRHAADRVEPDHGSVRVVGASSHAKRLLDIAFRAHPSSSLRL